MTKNQLAPLFKFLLLCPIGFGAAFWCGGEIAKGEISMGKLEEMTAKAQCLKVKQDVAPGVPLTADLFEVTSIFANRSIAEMESSPQAVAGKKARYGLVKGQVLVHADLN
jgi:flagella basal body P-ring formation protein FlgA